MSEFLINSVDAGNLDIFETVKNASLLYQMYDSYNQVLETLKTFIGCNLSIELQNLSDQENQTYFQYKKFEVIINDIILNFEESCYLINTAGSFRDKDCIFKVSKIVVYFDGIIGLELESEDKSYCFLVIN